MPTSTPSDLLSFLQSRALPKRLLRVGLALSSTVYTLRPDLLLAKSTPGAGTSSSGDWLGESGVTPFVPPAARFHSRGELFFIDAGVADPEAFWLAVPKNATVVSIPAGVDSWAFMAQAAEKFRGLAAIHLVSHGEHGALILNGRRYAAADLASHLGQLRQLGRALSKNGDIFLYGCEAGAGREGQALLDTIAAATGADVAASSDDTGSKARGGNWDLEVTTGPVDRSLMLNAKDMAGYDYVLNTASVSSISTLNSTISTFETNGSDNTITVTGNITFGLASDAITINVTGGHTLTIVGAGSGFTISGNNLARVINVTGGNVALSNLTISNGFVTGAGGNTPGTSAGLPGGDALGAGILNAGTLTIMGCTISGNKAAGGGGGGGGQGSYNPVSHVKSPGGGAGGGGGGFGSTFGGAGGSNYGTAGGAGSAGMGGNGAGYSTEGGIGGTTSGGAGSTYGHGYTNGGNGSTANNGTIAIGGGGGGAGYFFAGGRGGNAAGGIYNTGTLTITGSSIINNIGAGGGGGGGASSYSPGGPANGGLGGSGAGGLWNAGGTLHTDTGTNNSLLTGNTGGAGAGGQSTQGSPGAPGTATSTTVATTGGGTTVTNLDDPPVVGNLNGDSVNFTEKGSAVLIDSGSNATVTDADNANFSGGNLTVSIVTNRVSAEDVLGIVNQGSGAGQIGVSGSNVTFGGTTVGTFTGGSGTNDLVVSLNSSATPAATQALVREVTYSDSNTTTPSGLTRTVRVTVNDGSGGTSINADVSVTLTLVNDPPTLSATGGTPTFTEGGSAASLFSGTSISTIEAGQTIKTLVLTVSNVADGSNEVLNVDGSALALTNGNSLTTATNGMTASVSVSAGTATVTISKTAGISTAAAQTLVNGLTYQNNSSNPSTANRVVTLTSIQDNGGTSNGGIDTTSLSIAATVTVVAVDNAPVVTTSGSSAAFVAGDNTASTPVVIDNGLTVSDVDNTTQASGTVSITGNFHSGEDVLAFTNNPATMGNIAGVYNSGTGVLTLTSSGATATLAQWQAALRSVTYTDTAVTPNNSTRTVSFTVNDGTLSSSAATRTVTVTDTDQTPIVTTAGSTTTYTSGASATTIDGSVTVSDLDNTTQASGTVLISSGFNSGDTLAFTNNPATMGNIAGSYNAGTGVLTLTSAGATATDAQWQAALRSVTFSSSSTTYGSRTISFVVNDGTKTSATATDTFNVTNPVAVTTSGGSAAFVAGNNTASTPVAVDSGLTVTDASTSVLTSATVSITGNFHSGEDVLAFTNTSATTFGNISASYNSGTGVLTLTSAGNTATLAQWQAALRAVTFTDTAVTPNNATRTISFVVTDANSNVSNTATRTVTVADTDQSPITTTSGGSAAFVAGNNTASTPVVIDGALTVSDLDNTTLASATVSITGNFHSGEDVLGFTNNPATMGNIAGSYNSSTGVLTLTSSGATATLAQWQAALRAVTFTDTAVTPNNATRTISFVINDGTVNSSAATRTVTVADTDQTPIVTTSGGSAAFVAGNNLTSTPVAIDGAITVSDLDNTTLASASVSITGNFHSGEDVLAFTNTSATTFGNISATYNSGTGVLTLTSAGATSTIAQWRAALRAVTYTDTAVTPNNATRTISFVVNDGTNSSVTATRTITVTDTDQSPIVTTSGGTTAFVEVAPAPATPVVVDGGITVSDLDNATLASGTVSITGNFHSAEDVLAFTSGAPFGNIAGSYNSGTGVLTLTSAGATATIAQWQAALRSVTYTDSSVTPNTSNRAVSFVVSDGTASSISGTKTVTVTSVSATYAAPVPDGYAASATGGASTGAVTVLTAANFRTQAQSSTPGVITVAGVLNLGSTPVNVNSNKTIQGADANAGLLGNLNLASGVNNVIIRGLNLTNPGTIIVGGAYTDGGDGITISGARNVFITHCTFFDTANHAIAITNSADNITVSWCEFYYTAGQTVHRFSMLIGAPGAETVPLHVTLHHNFWSTNVDQQMPVATFGYVHLYSNDFNATGNTSGTVSSDQAQLLSERNVYTGMASPLFRQSVNLSLPFGLIFAQSNTYTATTGSAPDNGTDPVFTPTYSYEALPVSGVVAAVSANAGNISGASYTDPAAGTASITGPAGAVTSGTVFTLTAVPAGFTPVSYQWRVANQDISGATTSAINVSVAPSSIPYVYTVAIGLASGDVVVSTPFTVTPSAPSSASGSSVPVHHSGGGAMSEWLLGALAMLTTLRKMRPRRGART